MMLILGICCLMNALLFYYYAKRCLYPGVIFNMMWGMMLVLNALNLYKMYAVGFRSIFLISIGILAFNLTCIFQREITVRCVFGKMRLRKRRTDAPDYAAAAVWLNRFNLFVMLLLLLPLLRLVPVMRIYDGYTMRRIYTTGFYPDGSVFMGTIERLLYIHFGIMPACEALFTFTSILWLCGKIKAKYMIYPAVNMLFSCLISGGRMALFYCVVILGAGYLMAGKDFLPAQAKRRIKRAILAFSALCTAYILYNTFRRTNGEASPLADFFRAMDLYFTCGVHLFDHALKNPEACGLTHWTYGLSSFAGILSFLYYGSYFLTGGRFSIGVTSSFAQEYLAASVFLGDSVCLNAFPTMFYYPYRDFGVIGIIAAGSVLAVIGINLYSAAKNQKSIVSLIFFAEYVFFTVFSVCWLDTYRSEFWAKMMWLLMLKRLLTARTGTKLQK